MPRREAKPVSKRPVPVRSRNKAGNKGKEAVCPDELDLPRPSREDYVDGVREQLGDFEETLEAIESDMESSGWDDIGDFRGRLDGLRARLKEIRSQAEELMGAEDSAWPSLYEDMEKTLLEMSDGIQDISVELGRVLQD
jgi:hypothetical protein